MRRSVGLNKKNNNNSSKDLLTRTRMYGQMFRIKETNNTIIWWTSYPLNLDELLKSIRSSLIGTILANWLFWLNVRRTIARNATTSSTFRLLWLAFDGCIWIILTADWSHVATTRNFVTWLWHDASKYVWDACKCTSTISTIASKLAINVFGYGFTTKLIDVHRLELGNSSWIKSLDSRLLWRSTTTNPTCVLTPCASSATSCSVISGKKGSRSKASKFYAASY